MRIAVAENLQSRRGSLSKDAKVTNGLLEQNGDMPRLRKRPGFSAFSLVKTGVAQLLISWRGIKSVIGDYFCSGYSPSGSYTNSTTWNSADKAANVTLSGGNLNTTWSSGTTGYVRSSLSVATGLWYYEVTINTIGVPYIGFASSTASLTGAGFPENVMYFPVSGVIQGALGISYPVATATGGDVIGALYDATNATVVFYKNGSVLGSTGGADIPATTMFAFVGSSSAATDLTANFAGAFTYTPTANTTALVVTTGSMPFSGAFNGENAATPYLMINNAEFAWTIPNTGVVTKVTDADYPGNQTPARRTVPGIVYLDTYFFTMDTKGVIYNSAADDPTSWSALGFITAQFENGAGVALAKSQEYVAAFKEFSVELLYDAANPVGSPLSPVQNGFFKIGCASGTSLADIKGQIFWVSQSKQKGRSVHVMTGTNVAEVATPDVQRILNADDLATVHAYGVRVDGHDLYLLTLVTSNVTLAYDLTNKTWATWSSLTLGSAIGGTITITRSGTTATYASTVAHGVGDGDPVLISGCTQTEYNGIFQTQYVSAYSFTFEVTGSPATPATGSPVLKPYTESYFKYTKYTNYQGLDLSLHESDGYLYSMDSDLFRDNGLPINYVSRTSRMDGGTSDKKTMSRITYVGDIVADTAMVRWSDDDYATNRPYRILDLDEPKSMVRRCGSFIDRSIEFRHIGNTNPILDAIEIEVQK